MTTLSSRADREARARELRAEGLMLKEIAERMDAAISTVHAWLSDPGGRRLAARKASYAGTCLECGGPTSGSDGPPAERCLACLSWTREAILEALRTWAQAHGRSPYERDWDHVGVEGRRGQTPSHRAVARHFGCWSNGLLAAGLPLNLDRRPETQEAIEDAIHAGESTAAIAARYGVTRHAIYERLRVRGLSVRQLRAEGPRT